MNWGLFASIFEDEINGFFQEGVPPPERPEQDPGIGREFSASFQIIIPTAPEGFSNARIAASQVCSYAPGSGQTLDDRTAVAARELEALRNALLAEGERLRQGLNTGSYAVTGAVGTRQGRSRTR